MADDKPNEIVRELLLDPVHLAGDLLPSILALLSGGIYPLGGDPLPITGP